jgi:WD40 repeat protein
LVTDTKGKRIFAAKFPSEEIRGFKWTPNGRYLVVGSLDADSDGGNLFVRIFDALTWSLHYEVKTSSKRCATGYRDEISDLPVNFDRFLVTLNSCILDPEWGRELPGYGSDWSKFTHDYRYILSAGPGGVRLGPVASSTAYRKYSEEPSLLAWFSSDESKILAVAHNQLFLFNTKTGSKLINFDPPIGELSWSKFGRDESYIVGIQQMESRNEKQIVSWDVTSGRRSDSSSVLSKGLLFVEMLENGEVIAADMNGKISVVGSL